MNCKGNKPFKSILKLSIKYLNGKIDFKIAKSGSDKVYYKINC